MQTHFKYLGEDVISKEKLTYILGNPPFIGKQHKKKQRAKR